MGQPATTLANWRLPPQNAWAFKNIDKLIATRPIAAGAARALPQGAPLALEGLTAQALRDTHTDGFLVLHKGAIAAEHYHNCDAATRHILFSVSKSVTGTLAGILVGQGKLDPDRPVTAYVPEVAGSAYGDCTVRHVLDMTVSINFVEDYLDTAGDFARYRSATGWNPARAEFGGQALHGFIASLKRGGGPHGERFHYVSPNSDLLGWIVERAGAAPYHELLSRLLWQPMGAEAGGLITIDAKGAVRSAGGICCTLRDLARFGELMRLGGVAGRKQIVPKAWIDDILTKGDPAAWAKGSMAPLFPKGSYRSKWYMTNDASGTFCAIGIHGQWIYVDPSAEMVAVKQSSQPLPEDGTCDQLTLKMFRAIAERLRG
ncbi:MAG: serine hydrolase [Aestuariivirga sp.]